MEPHFFQILDRIRYESALNALTREGKSLALISPVQALAEHYKECLLERLQRELPDCEIKPFFPDDADAIVQKFNQVLADLPMFAIGLLSAYITALLVIRWLIRWVSQHSFNSFAIYRICAGVFVLAAVYIF